VAGPTAVPLNKILAYRGGCHVGDIPMDSLSQLPEMLREIPIVRQDLSWDCQTWVILATKLLKSAGFVFAQVDEPYVREQLLEDMARWEEAENTVDERLLASGGESS
jgi:hypothetical protein